MTTIEAWVAVTDLVTAEMTDCDVSRTYDVVQHLDELTNSSKPKVYVQLESRTVSARTCNPINVSDEYVFTIWLLWRPTTTNIESMDEIVPLIEQMADAFRYKRIAVGGEDIVFVGTETGVGGELYDREMYDGEELFVSSISITARTERNIE